MYVLCWSFYFIKRRFRVPRKTILIFSAHADWGGGEQSLLAFISAAHNEYHLHLALGEEGPLADKCRALEIPVHIAPIPYFLGNYRLVNGRYWYNFARLARLIRNIGSSSLYLYCNGLFKSELLILAMRLRFPQLRIISHIRNIFSDYPWHRHLALHLLNARVSISLFVRHQLPCFAKQSPMTHVFHNIVDLESMQIQQEAFSIPFNHDPPWHIGIYSRLSPEKGQLDFLQLAIKTRDMQLPWQFHIFGGPLYGGSFYIEEMQRLIESENLEDWVIWEGYKADVLKLIAKLDVVSVFSSFEPLGRVVMESQALGRITLAYAVGGPLELIKHRVTGWLVPPHQLDEALIFLQQAPQMADIMNIISRNSRQHALNAYSPQKYLTNWRKVISMR